MHEALSYKTKQFFFVLIKLTIVVGAAYFIYQKLTENPDFEFSTFVDILTKNSHFSIKNIIFLLILSIFNWFLEILKWQNLVRAVRKISFYESLQQSLASLTASLFTPNRIGDYAAKAIYFNGKERAKIMLMNLLSNMTQMGVTVLLGIIGISFFISTYNPQVSYYKLLRILTYTIIIIAIVGFGFNNKNFKIRGYSAKDILSYIKNLALSIHIKNILFSVLRYLVFSYQFYFLLTLFNIQLAYLDSMVLITTMYLLASVIPTIFIFDVVVKGGVALYVFNHIEINNLTILTVTTLMWLLNFVLPSIFGSYFVLNFNIIGFQKQS